MTFGFVKFKAGTAPHSSLEQVMYHAVKRQNYWNMCYIIRTVRIYKSWTPCLLFFHQGFFQTKIIFQKTKIFLVSSKYLQGSAEDHCLINQDEGLNGPPTSFSPVTPTNVGINPKHYFEF